MFGNLTSKFCSTLVQSKFQTRAFIRNFSHVKKFSAIKRCQNCGASCETNLSRKYFNSSSSFNALQTKQDTIEIEQDLIVSLDCKSK